jgi:hypothetical protein
VVDDPGLLKCLQRNAARMTLACARILGDAHRMGLLREVADVEVPADDLLAEVRTTAEVNEMIRAGLAAAGRGD